MISKQLHSFHIPVMGIGFTIDTPVKVAHYGISSVISLVDDGLMEKMREFYSNKLNIPYTAITDKVDDFRAKRTTAYLNLVEDIVGDKFEEFKNSIIENSHELGNYLSILPDDSSIKSGLEMFTTKNDCKDELKIWLDNNITPGSIDVNIMTKLDKQNYHKNETLPVEYNDAHAALRGFANSKLNSSIVLSAGLSPRLYSYFEKFDDFYPDENGIIKKKIVLKVSDYRSAIIQGKFLAKKGLWVSEYRIESGLNCGGHAFASDGFLLGPILDEFRLQRNLLIQTTHEILTESLKNKNRPYPQSPIDVKITAQGGVGTSEEHNFLIHYYQLDSIGWGTPFLLVPEVTNVDKHTRNTLVEAREEDLYLSKISPLGVPFNSLKGNTKDIEKLVLVDKGRPGSACPKKLLVSNTEFTEKAICVASRQYQNLKLKELDAKNLSSAEHTENFDKIVDKSCICVGLGTTPLINNDIERKKEGESVSICPGPNMAYFSKVISLKEMIDHIYGRTNIISRDDRPNMFIKELSLYISYLKERIEDASKPLTDKQMKYFDTFRQNMFDGIEYYKDLFSNVLLKFENVKTNLLDDLKVLEDELSQISLEIFTEVQTQRDFVKAV